MLDPGTLIGLIVDDQYLLKEVRGTGAFGIVFAADVVSSGLVLGTAAVKLLWPRDKEAREAIRREVEAMNLLQHPHLVAYKSSGEVADGAASGCIYIAMDLGSRSLAMDLAGGRRLSDEEVLELCVQIGSALAYLAGRSAIHCDVKPANILRVGNVWKLGDFGLVRAVSAGAGSRGTLRYTAPEMSRSPTVKSDVWSLGVVLQEAATGEPVYPGRSEVEILTRMAREDPRISAALSSVLRPIVSGCLARDPSRRFDASELVEKAQQALNALRDAASASSGPAPSPGRPAHHVPSTGRGTPTLPRPGHPPETARPTPAETASGGCVTALATYVLVLLLTTLGGWSVGWYCGDALQRTVSVASWSAELLFKVACLVLFHF